MGDWRGGVGIAKLKSFPAVLGVWYVQNEVELPDTVSLWVNSVFEGGFGSCTVIWLAERASE